MVVAAKDIDLVREAVTEVRSGNKPVARKLLEAACQLNLNNDKAWLWRASLAETTGEAIYFLEQVLRIDPGNATALAWLEKCVPKPAEQSVEEDAAPNPECPFCSYDEEQPFARCQRCRAVLHLDLSAIESNQGVDERQLRHAIEHYNKLNAGDVFEVQYYLAIAHLQLLQSQEAVLHLRKAAALVPDDVELKNVLDTLLWRKTIMVVDDSVTIRSVVGKTLEREKHRAILVSNGMDAIGVLREERVDLVLCDISMPLMDGYQLCKTIKDNPKTRKLPVVMLSGHDGFFDKVRGRMAGASDYITKPVEPPALLKAIRKYLVG
jgi:twitching motility two-component system response regulator PilG